MSDIASRVKAIIVDKLGVDENEVAILMGISKKIRLYLKLLKNLKNLDRKGKLLP